MIKVCIFTSAHHPFDSRIFYKECKSLAKADYEVVLVAPHEKNEWVDGVQIQAISMPKNRYERMLTTVWQVYRKAIEQKAIVYHFHDPELILVGLLLRWKGKKVIFDIHENIAQQIKVKRWVPFRKIISKSFFFFDLICSKFFFLILAEKSYERKYKKWTSRFIIIQNMPDIVFFKKYEVGLRNSNGIFYVGGISENRGIITLVEALRILKNNGTDFHFHCIGKFNPEFKKDKLLGKIKQYELNDFVTFYGRLEIEKAYQYSKNCSVGVSILKPIENYIDSYSTKIFEYMSISLPVVTSNFELYRNVIENYKCGICVDPENPEQIAAAIEYLLLNKDVANQMGENGRKAVEERYNWNRENKKLLQFYKELI